MDLSKDRRILQGMLEAVGAAGYEQTSVQDVIERSGVYRQAFYDRYGSKEDCYLRALEAGAEWVEGEIRAAAAGEREWRKQLRAGLGGLLAFLDAEPEIGRALVVEVHAAGPEAVAKRTEAIGRAAAQVDRARELGGEQAPAIAAEAAVAGILAVLHARLAGGRRDGFARLRPQLLYLAVLPYFGPEQAALEMQLDD